MVDIKQLIELYTLDETSLHALLTNTLKEYDYNVVESENEYIIATHDDGAEIGLVSHIDTVFDMKPTEKEITIIGQTIEGKKGLGADDRNGIYTILHLLGKGHRPTVIFTHDEEVGGLGASALVRDFIDPPKPLKYLVEIDREGIGQAVFYNCNNSDFKTYIKHSGFTSDYGTFTDISIISPVWDIASCNISAGYIDQHTFFETTFISGLEYTIQRLETMFIDSVNVPFYDYQKKPSYNYNYKWSGYNSAPTKTLAKKPTINGKGRCSCGEPYLFDHEMKQGFCDYCEYENRTAIKPITKTPSGYVTSFNDGDIFEDVFGRWRMTENGWEPLESGEGKEAKK